MLLSDYDGTLTPIVDRPELANLGPGTRKLLETLGRRHDFGIGIVSGRSLADLKQRVGIPGITYGGNHGLEVEGPRLSYLNPAAQELRPALGALHQALSDALGLIGGVWVEDKGLTLSVHYRQADEARVGEIGSILERKTEPLRALGKIWIAGGKKVYEVRPALAWDKGEVVALLVSRWRQAMGRDEVLSIYLGDDLSDEDGFRAVARLDGISILVGETDGASAARYFLRSPAEVERFLEMVLEARGWQ